VLLEGKNAVIYGAGGSIGGAVARAFAREGAKVFLAGRTDAGLDAVAEQIRSAGGVARTARLDALDEKAVDDHADAVVAEAGSLDIAFNLISHDYVQGTPMAEMELDDYLGPVVSTVRTTFLTWRAAARHMVERGSGVILAFGGEGHPIRGYYLGALQVALHAVESMRRQLALELGGRGVRVVTLRTGGVPEAIPDGIRSRDVIAQGIERATMLGRAATLEDVGNVAAFVASDRARTMTAATVNVSGGALID
jgi:NAD(P)-dependent dehydrogenase (short-subunit alcohol dehydrogenase family)